MRKKFFLVSMIAMMICLLAAASYAAAETKKIRFWSDQSEPWQQQVIKAMIEDFEASHSGVFPPITGTSAQCRTNPLSCTMILN